MHKENIPARAFDVAGVEESPVTGGRMVAVAANALVNQAPSFVYFLDASQDVTKPVGATILASSMTEGVATRIAMLRDKAYVLTSPKGIQVIDIGIAADEFQTMVNQAGMSGAITQLVNSQTGAYRGSITNTIPVSAGGWPNVPLAGIAAGDFILDGSSQALVLAAGSRVAPLIVANPQLPGSSAILYAAESISTAAGTLMSGLAVATGFVGGKNVAVVAGTGTVADGNGGQSATGNVLAIFDMTNPRQPAPMGFVALDGVAKSITIVDDTAYVGTNDHAIIVSLTESAHPVMSGIIDGFGGRLAINPHADYAYSADPNRIGVQSAALGPLDFIYCDTCPPQGCLIVGNPINPANGNAWISHTDYVIPGLGGGLALSRTWMSLWQIAQPIELAGMFGHSWRSNFEERIQVVDEATLRYWLSDGSTWIYSYMDGNWTQVSPVNEHSSLQYDGSKYTVAFLDGSRKVFNGSGYLTALVDRNGNQTSITYDSQNRITHVTDPASRVLTFNYGGVASKRVSSIQDSTGVVATYTYSGQLLTGVVYADNSEIGYRYNSSNLITSVVDGLGKVMEAHTYDSGRRGLTSEKADGVEKVTVGYTGTGTVTIADSSSKPSTATYTSIAGRKFMTGFSGGGCASCSIRENVTRIYDASGNITQETDALGRTTSYTYNGNGNVLSVTLPAVDGAHPTTHYTYNDFGEVLTIKDPAGNITRNTYDGNGNLTSITSPPPDGNTPPSVTELAYNSLGQLVQIKDPLQNVTAISYTPAGMVETITDAKQHVTRYEYDDRGNRTKIIDALQNQTEFTYDAGNRLLSIKYPGDTTTSFTYDHRGRRTSVTDQNGRTTSYAYDDADRLISVTDAENHVTQYAYDMESNLTGVTDANNHTTGFEYDANGRVIKATLPSTLYESYVYDAVGNLVGKTDRKGQTMEYVYDALDRLTQKKYPDAAHVDYVYDLIGRVKQVNDATGTYGFAYDNMSRLTGTTTAYSFLPGREFTNTYAYDSASNRTGFTAPDGSQTAYTYDTLNQLNTLASSWAGSFGFQHDEVGRRTQLTRPNGVNTGYSYNNLSQLLSVLHKVGETTVDGTSYVVDPTGIRTSKTDLPTGTTSNYGYDRIYQLLNVQQGGSATEEYAYDPVGNMLNSLNLGSHIYNESNQLTSTSAGSYSYDNNGNTLTDADGRSYTWDYQNQLIQTVMPSTGAVAFKYDPFGRRIQKSSSSGTVNYVYDGSAIVAEYDESGSLLVKYSQGPGIDEPLSQFRANAATYYQADGLGSVTSLTDSAGSVVSTYAYDSFGNQTASTGSLANPFRYTAREFDSETGLYFYRARWYDPQARRFLSEDPIGLQGGINLYAYVNNDPINMIDPQGLTTVTSDRFFPGSTFDSGTGFYTMNVDDGFNNTQALNRITWSRVDQEAKHMYERLKQYEFQNGGHSRRDINREKHFDTNFFRGGNSGRDYYYIECSDRIYADNEINYLGIGMYEAWLGTSKADAAAIVLLWKLQYINRKNWLPSGTWYWLFKGYDEYIKLRGTLPGPRYKIY